MMTGNKFLNSIYKILKPEGIIICICHNERHFLSRILKDKHPIINDEHVCVFNKKSLEKILTKHNFKIKKIKNLKNIYSIQYWLKMAPMHNYFTNFLLKVDYKTLNY